MTRYHQRFKSDVPVEQWRTLTGSNMRQREADNSFTPNALGVGPLSNDMFVDYPFYNLRGYTNDSGEIITPVSGLEFYDYAESTMTTANLVKFSADKPATAIRVTYDDATFRVLGVPSDDSTHIIVAFSNNADDTTHLARLDADYNLVWQKTVRNVWFYNNARMAMSADGTKIGVTYDTGDYPSNGIQIDSYNASNGALHQQREFNWYDATYSGWDFRLDMPGTFIGMNVCDDYMHIWVEPQRNNGGSDVSLGNCFLVANLNDLSEYKLTKIPALLRPYPIDSGNGGKHGLVYKYNVGGPFINSNQVIPAKLVTMWPDGSRSESYEIDTVGGPFGQIFISSINVNSGDSPLQITEMTHNAWVYGIGSTIIYSRLYPDESIVIYGDEWQIFGRNITTTWGTYPYTISSSAYDVFLYKSEQRDTNT